MLDILPGTWPAIARVDGTSACTSACTVPGTPPGACLGLPACYQAGWPDLSPELWRQFAEDPVALEAIPRQGKWLDAIVGRLADAGQHAAVTRLLATTPRAEYVPYLRRWAEEAICRRDARMIPLLAAAGLQYYTPDDHDLLRRAVHAGAVEPVVALLQCGAPMLAIGDPVRMRASDDIQHVLDSVMRDLVVLDEWMARGDTVEVEALLRNSLLTTHSRNLGGETPLLIAARRGDLATLQGQLARGADIDARDAGQRRAIDHLACSMGNVLLWAMLHPSEHCLTQAQADAVVKALSGEGRDAMTAILRALLETGSRDHLLQSLIRIGGVAGQAAGAEPAVPEVWGHLLAICLEAGLTLGDDSYGHAVLDRALATRKGWVIAAAMRRSAPALLARRADLAVQAPDDWRALCAAIQAGDAGLAMACLSEDPGAALRGGVAGMTPLILAAQTGDARMVALLLRHGAAASIGARDSDGRTALDHAVCHPSLVALWGELLPDGTSFPAEPEPALEMLAIHLASPGVSTSDAVRLLNRVGPEAAVRIAVVLSERIAAPPVLPDRLAWESRIGTLTLSVLSLLARDDAGAGAHAVAGGGGPTGHVERARDEMLRIVPRLTRYGARARAVAYAILDVLNAGPDPGARRVRRMHLVARLGDAAQGGNLAPLRLLRSIGLDIADDPGGRLLMAAVKQDDAGLVAALLKDRTALRVDASLRAAYREARARASGDVAECILAAVPASRDFHEAIAKGQAGKVRAMLATGAADVTTESVEHPYGPLAAALASGQPAIARLLLHHGAPIDASASDVPPLEVAVGFPAAAALWPRLCPDNHQLSQAMVARMVGHLALPGRGANRNIVAGLLPRLCPASRQLFIAEICRHEAYHLLGACRGALAVALTPEPGADTPQTDALLALCIRSVSESQVAADAIIPALGRAAAADSRVALAVTRHLTAVPGPDAFGFARRLASAGIPIAAEIRDSFVAAAMACGDQDLLLALAPAFGPNLRLHEAIREGGARPGLAPGVGAAWRDGGIGLFRRTPLMTALLSGRAQMACEIVLTGEGGIPACRDARDTDGKFAVEHALENPDLAPYWPMLLPRLLPSNRADRSRILDRICLDLERANLAPALFDAVADALALAAPGDIVPWLFASGMGSWRKRQLDDVVDAFMSRLNAASAVNATARAPQDREVIELLYWALVKGPATDFDPTRLLELVVPVLGRVSADDTAAQGQLAKVVRILSGRVKAMVDARRRPNALVRFFRYLFLREPYWLDRPCIRDCAGSSTMMTPMAWARKNARSPHLWHLLRDCRAAS